MDNSFRDILFAHEKEDSAAIRSQEETVSAVREEFANAEKLIAQAREKGFSLSEFFAGAELPADMDLPVRRSETFYVKKHTAVQRPYMHSHEFYELIYVQTGKCLQTLQDGSCVKLKKGQCCLIRPGEAHCVQRIDEGDVILKAVIPRELFDRCVCDITLPEEGLVVFEQTSLFAEYLFIRLLRESHMREAYHQTAISALLSLLFCELVRRREPKEAARLHFYDDYFRNDLKQASLDHFAREYGYTPAYASRSVKRQTGKKFSELLCEYRMQRAAELLSSSDMSVEDIAFEIGYKVPSALYRQFNTHFGMTPNEYRNALNKR